MRFEAVLFDLDGTLLDTLQDLADSFNQTLEKFGYPMHPVDAYREFVGDGAIIAIQRAMPRTERRDRGKVFACFQAFRKIYAKSWDVATKPYDGIPILLSKLTKRGLKLAVLSNKPQDSTEQCVRHLLPMSKFEIVHGEREGIARKPDPTSALAIAQQMGVSPDQCIFVGDTAVDMATAVAAGMLPVGVLWGFRTRGELLANGAEVTIENPADLLKLLV